MGGKKSADKTKVRVAHELPKRRIAIKEALEAHQTEDRLNGIGGQIGGTFACTGK